MPKHANISRRISRIALAVAASLGLTLGALTTVQVNQPAQAAGDSVALYISSPFVKGSHVTGAGVLTESFNGLTTCSSPTGIGTWTITSAANTCEIALNPSTATPTGEPELGGDLSNFVWGKTGFDSTFTFASSVKYVGLWWMMGSTNNTVQFLDSNNNVLATLNSNDIMTFFGVSGAGLNNSDTGTVARIDGGTHPRRYYFRSPGNYSGNPASPVTPDYNTTSWANEPWVYLNLFIAGNLSVSKLRLAGTNFEVDNITISPTESGPTGDMVLVKNVLGTPPDAQILSWLPTNTTADISDGALTPNVLATKTSPAQGGGAISYSVLDAGAAGCSVNSSSGDVTATGAGTCIIRATAAAVGTTYFAATKEVTFTFTANPVVTPAPYSGPSPIGISQKCVIAGAPTSVTVTGLRLNSITSASVSGTKVPVSEVTSSSLKLNLPAMKAGTYDIAYASDFGNLIHQESLKVCASSSSTVNANGPLTVSKRFTGYRGDRGPVVPTDRTAIERFISSNPGLTSVTCTGSTSGVPARSTDLALATARAENACRIVKALLPEVETKIATRTGRGVGQFHRAVILSGTGIR